MSGRFELEVILLNSARVTQTLEELGDKDGLLSDMLWVDAEMLFLIVKDRALEIIETGDGMAPNIGKYALNKANGKVFKESYGGWHVVTDPSSRTHPLGRISGELYAGVFQQMSDIPEVKSRRVNQPPYQSSLRPGYVSSPRSILEMVGDRTSTITFNRPNYIGEVHDGKPGVVSRPFITKATLDISPAIEQELADSITNDFRLDDANTITAAFRIRRNED